MRGLTQYNTRSNENYSQQKGNFRNNRGRGGINKPQGAYCYFHSKFGNLATNCAERCRFKRDIESAVQESQKHAPGGSNNNQPTQENSKN